MTRERILLQLQQEYAQRREDAHRRFDEHQREACERCPGLRELITARHAAVADGVRATLLAGRKRTGEPLSMGDVMRDLNRQIGDALEQGGLPRDYLQPVYACAACHDEGYVYDPSRRMCDCLRAELSRRTLALSGLGENAGSFERFNPDVFSAHAESEGVSQRRLAEANRDICLRFAEQFPNTATRDMLLIGKSGLGKTYLMQCVARRVLERGFPLEYVSAYRMFETARQAYMENDSGLLSALMETPLLLIDDLGTEPLMSNVTVTQLFNLLNERQLAGRHTVISTNLTVDELRQRYTERVTSRLLDVSNCARLHFIGADVRLRPARREDKA